ncbi:hypothetical protein [Alysiella crassa]|uniref:Uncharacterized protein n=1 Tax=Alysiella crassa TaxID=153491 RepID=A0A376BUL2_9NEIS|nr:hypothetical protein [Alysiella crassa]UOP06074.1 hypothetical protein LVJ80_09510 [Alysiella crassa]SSY80531.1 Uncharacterised protein [Alysiella crassa]
MSFKVFITYLLHLYRFSFLKFHLTVILIVFFSYLIPQVLIYFKLFDFEFKTLVSNLTNNLSNVLAGMSILMAFFVFIIQGINFSKINDIFQEEIPFKCNKSVTKYYKANKVIKNTIFSFILTSFLLFIPLVFLLLIRPSNNIDILDFVVFIMILLIVVYLLLGILFSMVFWSYTVTKS